ncbi:hypothetical protein EUTSA_v10025163mg [Eutrema salsugineum]|uniref:DUF4220 domain-containing protein n=1 Tax=Eutrema salsugineum TaxID=72664 RepID=V4MG24_EUTSA|nr:hypothetical protein EUTSA_v10025163mg [Eutrema salsugineum]
MLQTSSSAFDYTEQPDNLDMDSIIASEMYMKEHRRQLKPPKLMIPNRKLTHLEILHLELRDESMAFFRAPKLQDEEALRIMEAELDFIYEGLYTKGAVLHSWVGLVSRFISLGSLLSAFTIYHYRHNKIQEFHNADIVITYTLFLVGIALDVMSLYIFMVSDWTIAMLSTLKDDFERIPSRKDRILDWVLGLKRPKWKWQTCREEHKQEVLNTPFLLRRWTGSITMFNFITYSMNADTERIHNPRGGTFQLLWKTLLCPFSYVTSVHNLDYDHSLLIWHIATELCYQEKDSAKEKCDNSEYHTNRKISKMLSDYMMYLLIMQPKLMSEVAGIGKIRFRDTLAEADRLFKKMRIENSRYVKFASGVILSVDTSIEPRDVKGNHSKSVLFEASSLAKELQRLERDFGQDKWKTLSKVWLEFLFHAASHCDATTRMELLSKGGEFINFVWLQMSHFGLGD